MAIVDSSMSDHKQIILQMKKFKPPSKQKVKYEAVDYEKLYNILKTTQHDVPNDFTSIESFIQTLVKNSKVTKTKILNLPQKDWINKNVIQSISLRNEAWRSYRQDPENEDLKKDYETNRHNTAQEIKNTRDAYYYKEFKKCNKDLKHMWKLINTLATNKIKTDTVTPKLISGSNSITDPIQVCETFNIFFSTIGSILAKQIPLHYHKKLTQTLSSTTLDTNTNSLSELKPCSEVEINTIINNLDSNSSTGIDGISTKSLKCMKSLILDNLTTCFNKLLADGKFPESLKVAKVTPIYKSGNKTDPSNYRPISVLPVISKVLEKILYSRLDAYLASINFISSRQYGFRPQSNTLSATVDLVTKIKYNIDQKKIVLGLFIDLKKAFDTVSHSKLINKLRGIGVTGKALKMYESYLANRSQLVKINNSQSNHQPITYGIPQGSVLGPLLFLIYVNDMHEIGLHGQITLYADDTCLFYFGSSIHEMISQAQQDLDTLFEWLQSNLLTVNVQKTCYLIFKAKNKTLPQHSPLILNGTALQEKQDEKYLGLRLDSNLNWHVQIDYIQSKLSSLAGSLRRVVRCFPRQVRVAIYNSLVKPHLTYLIEIWGTASKTKLNELQTLQNRIIKTLFHYPYLTPTVKVYSETKLMNIKQLYTYTTCLLIRKILNKHIQTDITFTKKSQSHKYCGRKGDHLILPMVRTNYGKKSLTFDGVQLYNKLPPDVKHAKTLRAFKSGLAKYIVRTQK